MAARLPTAARTYLAQLRDALGHLPGSERESILSDTRRRIAKLPGRGRWMPDIIAALGPAEALAGSFEKVEPEALKVRSGYEFLTRILAWPTFAFALLTAAVLLFAPQAGITTSIDTASSFSDQSVSFGYIEQDGRPGWINTELLPAALVALVPALFSLTPLILRGKASAVLQLFGALVMSAVTVLAGFSIGLFFLPFVILLFSLFLVPPVMMRGAMGRAGWVWRTIGTLLLLAVLAVAALGILRATTSWLLLVPALVLVPVLGHLVRWRWAEIALIAVGLAFIIYAALMMPTMIWGFLAGGLFFLVGHLGLAGNMWHRRSASLLALL